jgi:transketolase
MLDMRDAFFFELHEIMHEDKNVYLLTADHGAFGADRIHADFPNQYLNVGIAEQNLISIAAGLALSGKIVYVYGIVNFVTLRCLDQINIDIASMNLHINIIGVGAGFTYSTDGPTHHGTQDIAVMSAIPNFSIYNCTDIINTKAFARIGYEQPGPKYIRIEKGTVETIYDDTFDAAVGVYKIRDGKFGTIVSSGRMMHNALSISKELADDEIGIAVLDVFRLKPFPSRELATLLKKVPYVVILEDNVSYGGLGDRVCSTLIDYCMCPTVSKLNVGDKFVFNYSNNRESIEQSAFGEYIL